MPVHVKSLRAALLAAIFGCCCLLVIFVVAFSPPGQKLKNQHPHASRTLGKAPTALAAPGTYNTAKDKVDEVPLQPGAPVSYQEATSSAEETASSETGLSMTQTTLDPDAGQDDVGASLERTALIAGAELATAVASAGAGASANGAGNDSSKSSGDEADLDAITQIFHLFSKDLEDPGHRRRSEPHSYIAHDHIYPSSKRAGPFPSSLQESADTGTISSKVARIISSGNRLPSKPSPHTHAEQRHHQADDITASVHLPRASAIVTADDTASHTPSFKRGSTALSSANKLTPSAPEAETEGREVGEALNSAEAPDLSASSAPYEEFSHRSQSFFSDDADEHVLFTKPHRSAWLCRISEPHKGCNKRLYYPGMNDRTYDVESSAGKHYRSASCPPGYCCSQTACSSFGCGNICSDSATLCWLQYAYRSYGRGCSCAEQPAPRCHPLATCHESLTPGGGVWCVCPKGYKGNGLVCCADEDPGCNDIIRRPGVQPAPQSTGSYVFVSWTTLCLLAATCALLHGVY